MPLSFTQHLRSMSLSKVLFFMLPPSLIVLTLVYALANLLASPSVSYWFMLFLLVVCTSSSAMIYPDKLARFLGGPAVVLLLVFSSFYLGLVSERSFTLLSCIVGVLACQGLNVLSVFSGNAVSMAVQVACFSTALSTPFIGAAAHFMTRFEDAFMCGLLASCTASLFNLLCNRTPNSVSLGIPGRDFQVGGSGPGSGFGFGPASSVSGLATPQIVSPSTQFRNRRL